MEKSFVLDQTGRRPAAVLVWKKGALNTTGVYAAHLKRGPCGPDCLFLKR
ncbi:MAG: hypothetical protein JW944_08540 [Deltaproteobacteria bacterium]|nr:hypothetical protein [Deltaproteobacteria bacterium]